MKSSTCSSELSEPPPSSPQNPPTPKLIPKRKKPISSKQYQRPFNTSLKRKAYDLSSDDSDTHPNPTTKSSQRRPPMSDENKAVEILQQIRRQYDWSIGDLITAITKHKRNKAIAKQFAIYKRTAYSKIFEEENWSMTGKEEEEFIKKYGIRMLGPHIRRELQTLEKTPCFGKYSYSKETDSLSAIRNGAQVLDDHAPLLVSILKHIPHEYRPSGKYTSDILTDSRHVIIAAILGNLYHRNSFEAIQLGLGLYLYQGGTRTRTLDTLSNMGICRGSTAISTKYQQMVAYGKAEVRAIGQQNSAIVAYDNFDYAVGRRGERVGEKREFCSITTALITEGRFVPKEGLTQAMWNPFTLLTSSTFLRYLKADNMFNDVSILSPTSSY